MGGVLASIVTRATAFALVWWALAEGRVDSWGVGGVSVALAVAASLYLAPAAPGRPSPGGLLRFVGFFLVQSARGVSRWRPRPFARA